MQIPLFPLNTVLFPGMVLPLQVFEPRYLKMVARCLSDEGCFGVVLIREGGEVGPTAEPYGVGTLARIQSVDKEPGGTLHIVAVGVRRFQINEMLEDQPWPSADITEWPIDPGEPSTVERLSDRVRALFGEYRTNLSEATNLKLKINSIPDEPEALASLVAIAMQIELRDKQKVIEAETLPAMLEAEVGLLAREKMILEYVRDSQDRQKHLRLGPTGQMFLN